MDNLQSLYRTYRPHSFAEIVGQDYVVTVLKNAIASHRISHAYVFAGPHGTGKTSLARIFAKAINNEKTTDRSLDIVEIDAASNNGVDDVRMLIDSSSYVPAVANYKVFIIDEAHMLTKGAWNALLKTLEEPPAHVVMILATTEVTKIPATILSRCQKLNFRLLSNSTIIQELNRVLSVEKIPFENEALTKIAALANGSMRDALSITEQIIMAGKKNVNLATVNSALGLVDNSAVIKLINQLAAGNLATALTTFNNFYKAGASINELVNSIIALGRDWLILNKTALPDLLISASASELSTLTINEAFAQKMIDEALKLKVDMRILTSHRELFEIFALHILKNPETAPLEEVKVAAKTPQKPASADLAKTTPTNILKNEEMDVSRTSFVVKLLVAASKQQLRERHAKWEAVHELAQANEQFTHLITVFSKVKLIAAGSNFVMVTGAEAIVNELQALQNDQSLFNFTRILWGEPLYVFAITENQFLVARDLWLKLNSNNSLPAPAVIPVPQ